MEELIQKTSLNFEQIKHTDENGVEYWYARELQKILEYKEWRKFEGVIQKAKEACKNSDIKCLDHFVGADKMVQIGSGAERIQSDYKLTRYACYLIAQNGDSRKETIALAQTYFAVKTRKQELTEEQYKKLSEDERRLYNRRIVKDKNRYLFNTAKDAGVKNYGKFNNAGYKGLYNGETAEKIKKRKQLKEKDDILDFMGSEELGANIFRITQTEAKLKKDKINNEESACNTHYIVGKAVRKTIKDIGGTMPEELPTPQKGIKQIEKERIKLIK